MAFTLVTVEGFAPDWTTLGYLLALVGCFLLANGILFRNPRALVAERLGRYVVTHNLQSVGSPHHEACDPDESFKTCLLRAIRHYKLKRALEHRRSAWWR